MKQRVLTLILLLAMAPAMGIQAESFKDKMKRKGCERSCAAAEQKGVKECSEDHEKKGENKNKYESICKDVGRIARDKCVSKCMAQ